MRLVTLMRVRSRVDRLGSSRHPGPEQSRPHWHVPFPGPGALGPWSPYVWPLLCAGQRPSSCHFCYGRCLYDGQALTFRWAATPRRLVPPWHSRWFRSRVRDRPLLRWARDPRMFGPYCALCRDRTTLAFVLGEVPMTGRPLLCAGPPRLDGSSHSLRAWSRVRNRPLFFAPGT